MTLLQSPPSWENDITDPKVSDWEKSITDPPVAAPPQLINRLGTTQFDTLPTPPAVPLSIDRATNERLTAGLAARGNLEENYKLFSELNPDMVPKEQPSMRATLPNEEPGQGFFKAAGRSLASVPANIAALARGLGIPGTETADTFWSAVEQPAEGERGRDFATWAGEFVGGTAKWTAGNLLGIADAMGTAYRTSYAETGNAPSALGSAVLSGASLGIGLKVLGGVAPEIKSQIGKMIIAGDYGGAAKLASGALRVMAAQGGANTVAGALDRIQKGYATGADMTQVADEVAASAPADFMGGVEQGAMLHIASTLHSAIETAANIPKLRREFQGSNLPANEALSARGKIPGLQEPPQPISGRPLLHDDAQVRAYVNANPEGAAYLASKKSPSRQDLNRAGLTGEFRAGQRERLAERVRAIQSEAQPARPADQNAERSHRPSESGRDPTAVQPVPETSTQVAQQESASSNPTTEGVRTNPRPEPQAGIQRSPDIGDAVAPPPSTALAGVRSAIGAASAQELAAPPASVKNAYTEWRREALGLDNRDPVERRAHSELDAQAKLVLDANPNAGNELIQKVLGGESGSEKNTPLSDKETAVLGLHIAKTENQLAAVDDMMTAAEQRGDNAAIEALSQQHDSIVAQLNYAYDAAEATGTAQGRALAARRMAWLKDLSLAKMQRMARNAAGRDLAPAESEKIAQLHAKIKELQQKLDEADRKQLDAATDRAADKTIRKQSRKSQEVKDAEETPAEVLASGEEDFAALVKRLAEAHVRAGISERDALMRAVHKDVVTLFPDASEHDVRLAFTGYGKSIPYSTDPIDMLVRELRGQLLQVEKLRSMEAGKAPEATGKQRQPPGDEQRRLTKLVNERKKRGGFVVTDPARQLKSALDAVKTRLKNEISDLAKQIATRTKIVKDRAKLAYDDEANALLKRRDELKAQFDAVFGTKGLTDEQRLAMATRAVEKSLAEYERRIKEADFSLVERARHASPELDALRARRDAVKATYDALRALDPMESVRASEQALARSVAELEKKIATGGASVPAKTKSAWSEKIADLKAKQKSLAEELDRIRGDRGLTPEQRVQRAEDALRRQIDKFDKPKNAPESSPWSLAISEMRAKLQEMRDTPEHQALLEQRLTSAYVQRLTDRLARLKERQSARDYAAKPKKPAPKLDAEQQRLKGEVDKLAKQFGREMQAYRNIKRWNAETAAIHDVIQAGKPIVPPEPRENPLFRRTPEERRAQHEYEEAKRVRDDRLREQEQKARPIYRRIFSGLIALPRLLDTTGELSVVARQGWTELTSHPASFIPMVWDDLRALVSEGAARVRDRELYMRENAPLYRDAGLRIVHPEQALVAGEVAAIHSWAEKIPGIKQINRFSRVFLNDLRAKRFDAIMASRGIDPYSSPEAMQQARAIAAAINEATGAGSLGKFEGAASVLNSVAFSARFTASRFQYLLGHSMWHADAKTRVVIAKEYGRTLVGTLTFYGIAYAAGATIGLDPRSSDFGKIIVGKTRIDPLAGLLQVTVLFARLVSGETKTPAGKVYPIRGKVPFGHPDAREVVSDFLTNKLAPVPTLIFDALSGHKRDHSEFSLENEAPYPITWGDIYAAMKSEGVPAGAAMGAAGFFGLGLQTYSDPVKRRERAYLSD